MAEFHPWNGRIQIGSHKYARGFLRDEWQLFWLANFLNLNRLIRRREDDRHYIANWRAGVTSPMPGLYVYTPLAMLPYIKLPGLDSQYVAHRCLHSTWPRLGSLLERSGFDSVEVLWITHPRLVSVEDLVEYEVLVYRMSDDVAQFQQEPRTINAVEQELCKRADLVFCTAWSLVEKAEAWGANAVYLPNGVDFELFNADENPEPPDLAGISRPRILYLGAISDWLDIDLLALAAQRHRDLSFVLVGPVVGTDQVATSIRQLAEEPNAYVLGSKPFHQVPAYMRFSDVGLIPFRVTPLTNSINPIKLFEYNACGLPTVAADLQEIRQLGSPALTYNTSEQFIDCVLRVLDERSTLNTEAIAFAKENTWKWRFRTVREEIAQLYQRWL
jgi:hypothetical protein